MRFKLFLSVLIAILTVQSNTLLAQWVRANGGQSGYVTCLAAIGDSVFEETLSYQTHTGNLFLTTDHGGNWSQSDNGLPIRLPYSTVLTVVKSDGTLFAGTSDSGVYRSTNGGASWTPSGLPATKVTSL